MALRIRLARRGSKKRPVYSIVVAPHTSARDGKFVEKVGSYSPLLANDHPSRIVLNDERIKYWLSVGAKPSERVELFLGKAGLVDMPEQPNRPKKSAMKQKALDRIQEAEDAKAAAEEAAKAEAEAAKAEAEKPAEEAPAEEAKAEEPSAE